MTATSCWRWRRGSRSGRRVTTYPLERAEQALADLRAGRFEGSAVVQI